MKEKYIQSSFLMDMAKYFYAILLFFRMRFSRTLFFRFNGREYAYFTHPYNGTWMNERAVEIPLIWEQVNSCSPEETLEVGNVLSHYFNVKHLVVDKYEKFPGGIAKDIVDVSLPKQFKCIVSISTIEHVGWDEVPRVSGKYLQAIEKMRLFLMPGGKMFITIPLGYNLPLQLDLFSGNLGCDQVFYFKRLSREVWSQSSEDQVRNSTYGIKYRTTDGLAICMWQG